VRLSTAALLVAGGMALACVSASAESLWPSSGRAPSADLFTDIKARGLGDVVTVIVAEEAKLSNSAQLNLNKDTMTKAEMPTLDVPKGLNASKVFTGTTPKLEMSSNRKFDGEGSYVVEDSFETRVAAIVVEVLPNGNLVIEGSRTNTMGKDVREVKVSGIVRPADIGADNTVQSTVLADATITIKRRGPIARSTVRGFLNRVLDVVWPF